MFPIISFTPTTVIDCCELWYKMKLFQSMQKFYQVCGINQPQSNDALNIRIVVILIFIFFNFVSIVGTFFFKSTSFSEYIDTFDILITIVTCSMNIFECLWKRSEVFRFIKRLEEFIEKSNLKYINRCFGQLKWIFFLNFNNIGSDNLAFKTMDIELNDKIERITTVMYVLQVTATMAAILVPAVLFTLMNYFIFNQNDQLYFLPIPLTYVRNDVLNIYTHEANLSKLP